MFNCWYFLLLLIWKYFYLMCGVSVGRRWERRREPALNPSQISWHSTPCDTHSIWSLCSRNPYLMNTWIMIRSPLTSPWKHPSETMTLNEYLISIHDLNPWRISLHSVFNNTVTIWLKGYSRKMKEGMDYFWFCFLK